MLSSEIFLFNLFKIVATLIPAFRNVLSKLPQFMKKILNCRGTMVNKNIILSKLPHEIKVTPFYGTVTIHRTRVDKWDKLGFCHR